MKSFFFFNDTATTEIYTLSLHDALPINGLWWDAKGDWTRAHESAQQDEGMEGSWVHAYLHRKEGDQGNAAYWYNRAGKPVSPDPLDAEWLCIVKALLG